MIKKIRFNVQLVINMIKMITEDINIIKHELKRLNSNMENKDCSNIVITDLQKQIDDTYKLKNGMYSFKKHKTG